MFINKIICQECNGSGFLPQYKHIENGICFTCGGSGLDEEVSNEQKETPNPKEYYKQYITQNETNKPYKNWTIEDYTNKLEEIRKTVNEYEKEWKNGNDEMFDKLEELKSEYRDIDKKLKLIKRKR